MKSKCVSCTRVIRPYNILICVAFAAEDHIQQIDDPNDDGDSNRRVEHAPDQPEDYPQRPFDHVECDHGQDKVHDPGSDALAIHVHFLLGTTSIAHYGTDFLPVSWRTMWIRSQVRAS